MKIVKSIKSKDNKTIKYLQKTEDGHIIETGYYDLDEHIICISSQIGCSMGCIFCATTTPVDLDKPDKSFVRNLIAEEIVEQVENILDLIDEDNLNSKGILFSFMGMGEPFLNYENVVESIKTLSHRFPKSRTTVCTLGILPDLMRRLAHEEILNTLKMHLSIHASNDLLRKKILPKSEDIKPALEALKYFSLVKNTTSKLNYVLIKGLNDSEDNANQLAKLLQPYLFTVKLSKLNDFNSLGGSDIDQFCVFEEILNSKRIKTCRFFSTGADIEAGCGQLRRQFLDEQL